MKYREHEIVCYIVVEIVDYAIIYINNIDFKAKNTSSTIVQDKSERTKTRIFF